MKMISLGLLFRDGEYAAALARAIAETERCFFPAILTRDRVHTFDGCAILTDDEELRDERAVFFSDFMLPAQAVRAVREKCGRDAWLFPGNSPERGRLLLVTSACGGSGVTAVADGLAEEFTVYYSKKVCRLSLSAFPENGEEREADELSRLLFCPERAEEEPKTVIPGFFAADAAGIFRPSYGESVNPLALLPKEELQRFLSLLTEQGGFDYVIADVPAELFIRLDTALLIADRIVAVRRCGAPLERDARQEAYLTLFFEGNTGERLLWLRNCVSGASAETERESAEAAAASDREAESEVTAEYDGDAFRKARAGIDGAFGLAMKEVAYKLAFC